MTTKGMYKLDDGNCRPTNCFPARSLLRPKYEEGAGHWQVARQTAEKTKIELLLGAKATRVKWKGPPQPTDAQRHMHEKILDGVQLMMLHHVRSPSHLCSVDISNQNFTSAKEEDFEQFDSVAYINATENLLMLEVFCTFPGLRELELSLNGLRNLKVSAGDFPHLEVLDLSYNNLSPEDVQVLGVLSHLKVLHLTANGLHSLPLDLAIPDSESHPRFSALEVLLLDDNHLSHPNVFVSLANLRSLKQLNLDKNGIKEVPYLHCGNNSQFSIHPLSAKSGIREGLRSRKSAGKRLRQNRSGLDKQPDYIVLPNSKDPDRTEIIFPSPDPVTQENSSPGIPSHCETSASFSQEFTLPLPELRFLSLANNQIEHEEDLLAVALFPSLTELTFHGNPFTISRSGDPPLLSSFLQNKLGIKLVRKKISKLEKPRIFIPVKANRKVKSQLPKIRKRPLMLEAPQEAAFWELWTGAEVDPDNLMTLEESEPLPPIKTFSAEGIDRAEPSEEATFTPVAAVASQSLEEVLGTVPVAMSSLDQILSASGPTGQTSMEQILSAAKSLPSVAKQTQLGRAASAGSLLTEEVLSEHLAQEENLSEAGSLSGIAAAEQDQVEPAPPPNSPLPEQDPEKHVSADGLPAAEQDPDSISSPAQQDHLQPPSAPLQEQDLPHPELPLSPTPTEKQHLSETDLSTGPLLDAQEQQEHIQAGLLPDGQDQGQHLPASPLPDQQEHLPAGPVLDAPDQGQHLPASPLPDQQELLPSGPVLDAPDQGQNLPASPLPDQQELLPAGPVLDAPDQGQHLPAGPLPDAQEQAQLPSLPSQAEVLIEPVSPTRLPTEKQDLPEILPSNRLPSAEPDHLESVPLPSSPLQEQDLPEPVPPTPPAPAGEQNVAEQHLSGTSPLPEPPPEGQDLSGSVPPATPTFQEPKQPEHEPPISSVPWESSWNRPTSSMSQGVESSEPVATFTASGKTEKLIRLHSSSRDLYLLLSQARQSLLEGSEEHSSDFELFSSSSSEGSLESRKSESFFMTQVLEPSTSQLRKETPALQQPSGVKIMELRQVPEKYRGYEELLDSHTDKDPDFIEPAGIQQNVKALKKALRYPLVYRESKAKLDSLQKRFVPMEKKVLRIPPAQPRQTKEQKLEEILHKMRTPTNIVEVPLVCILRKRKSNWREYREALALLKEFQQEYKATVTACGMGSESKIIGRLVGQAGPSQSQPVGGLAGVQLPEEAPAQITEEDEGL